MMHLLLSEQLEVLFGVRDLPPICHVHLTLSCIGNEQFFGAMVRGYA
jgi:hypothetical protein